MCDNDCCECDWRDIENNSSAIVDLELEVKSLKQSMEVAQNSLSNIYDDMLKLHERIRQLEEGKEDA